MRIVVTALAVLLLALGALFLARPGEEEATEASVAVAPGLGPVNGFDLPPTELDRVAVGTVAPDFALESFENGVVQLSDYQGVKDVVLVVYRGHW